MLYGSHHQDEAHRRLQRGGRQQGKSGEDSLFVSEQPSIEHRAAAKLRTQLSDAKVDAGVSASTLAVMHFLEDLALTLDAVCLADAKHWKSFQSRKFNKVACTLDCNSNGSSFAIGVLQLQ